MLTPDAGVDIKITDIEAGGGVDASGVTHRILLRSDIKTWEFTYGTLTAEEYAYTRSIIKGKRDFQFTFHDETGQKQSVTAYCKQTSVSWWNEHRGLYKNLQFSIIEC